MLEASIFVLLWVSIQFILILGFWVQLSRLPPRALQASYRIPTTRRGWFRIHPTPLVVGNQWLFGRNYMSDEPSAIHSLWSSSWPWRWEEIGWRRIEYFLRCSWTSSSWFFMATLSFMSVAFVFDCEVLLKRSSPSISVGEGDGVCPLGHLGYFPAKCSASLNCTPSASEPLYRCFLLLILILSWYLQALGIVESLAKFLTVWECRRVCFHFSCIAKCRHRKQGKRTEEENKTWKNPGTETMLQTSKGMRQWTTFLFASADLRFPSFVLYVAKE